MIYRLLADAVLVLHLLFVVFALLGGLLVLWRRALLWLHLPSLAWAAAVEATGWICPLTPLENRLRRMAGEAGYEGGFLEHYLLPLLYPEDLTRALQWQLLGILLIVNLAVYAMVWRHYRR